MSDFHASAYNNAEKFHRWVRRANELEPDLVILLGDFLEGRGLGERDLAAVRVLKDLKAEKGVLAVPGNHDYDKHAPFEGLHREVVEGVVKALAPQVRFLFNEVMEFELRGKKLRLAGLDELWSGNLDGRLAKGKGDALNLVAVHNPDALDELEGIKDTLVVCGHTHGGQIRLPLLGQVIKQPDTRYGRRYNRGMYALAGGNALYVSSGLGALGTRARLFCPPEIVVLDIY